uniref:Myelin and lymphocyte protein n=1 Tax=Geospiza parvula TaxID=87175 RepID=A0A8C3MUH3_GEOPR
MVEVVCPASIIPGCLWDISRPHCLSPLTSWPTLATLVSSAVTTSGVQGHAGSLCKSKGTRGCPGGCAQVSPAALSCHPVPLGPAQEPAWHARLRGQPNSAASAPGLPLHLPNTSHVTPGHRVWPHLCHSQLSSSVSRKKEGKEPGQEGEERGRKESRKGGRERGRGEEAAFSSEEQSGRETPCQRLPMSSSTSTSTLPSGLAVLTTFPDVLFIPEIIFGGLVWILVASSKVQFPMLQGWVMFVSVFCFVMSISLLCLYLCGAHSSGGSCWVALDAFCHSTAALFYLSAAVLEAFVTYAIRDNFSWAQEYRENIAAVVFAFVATLLYVIHEVFSLLRWKSS